MISEGFCGFGQDCHLNTDFVIEGVGLVSGPVKGGGGMGGIKLRVALVSRQCGEDLYIKRNRGER